MSKAGANCLMIATAFFVGIFLMWFIYTGSFSEMVVDSVSYCVVEETIEREEAEETFEKYRGRVFLTDHFFYGEIFCVHNLVSHFPSGCYAHCRMIE